MRRRYKITNVGFLGGTKKEIVEFILESNKDSRACIITSAGLRQGNACLPPPCLISGMY